MPKPPPRPASETSAWPRTRSVASPHTSMSSREAAEPAETAAAYPEGLKRFSPTARPVPQPPLSSRQSGARKTTKSTQARHQTNEKVNDGWLVHNQAGSAVPGDADHVVALLAQVGVPGVGQADGAFQGRGGACRASASTWPRGDTIMVGQCWPPWATFA